MVQLSTIQNTPLESARYSRVVKVLPPEAASYKTPNFFTTLTKTKKYAMETIHK